MIYSKSVVNESWGNVFVRACASALLMSFVTAPLRASEAKSLFTMAAVGDSVTAGVNSTGWGAQLQDSWSTGASPSGVVDSHFLKLKQIIDGPIKAINVARGGATSNTVDRQIEELRGQDLDYVTFLIGSNDVCQFTSDYTEQLKKFRSNVQGSIENIVMTNPGVKILVLPVPNLFALWELGNQNNCQWLWNATGMCSRLLHASRSQEQRETFKAKVTEVNEILFSMEDEFPENVRIDPALAKKKFGIDDLSPLDCFHPSGEGQNHISQASWLNGWYGPGA